MTGSNQAGFLFVKLFKKYFGFPDDIFVCFCYIPPKGSVYYKSVDINLFDVLESDIRHYSDFGLIMTAKLLTRANKQFRKYRSNELHEALIKRWARFKYNETKKKGSMIRRLQIPKHSGLGNENIDLGENNTMHYDTSVLMV